MVDHRLGKAFGNSFGEGEIPGNYVLLLDEKAYVTAAQPRNVARWRIRDNLLGGPAFCPMIRRTTELASQFKKDWREAAEAVLRDTPDLLLVRVLGYFYAKETRSSFLIEREEPEVSRQERFIAALRKAGSITSVKESLSVSRLVGLQNEIVDARYRATDFRTIQNYVGETLPDFSEMVHYVCPPPNRVRSLWDGVVESAVRLEAAQPIVQAAVIAFQFVFIHPFLDGNGRIHRFLLQDTLARRQLLPRDLMVPLSATILNDMAAYDAALKEFSKPVVAFADLDVETDLSLTLRNGDQLLPFWRFPDLTRQTEYLHRVLEQAIEAIPHEIEFLRRFDALRAAISEIVDMPDRKRDLLLTLMRKNAGHLSERKRTSLFNELTDDEVRRIETAYRKHTKK